jgi:hypothetical protein
LERKVPHEQEYEYVGIEGAHNFAFKSITGTCVLRHPDISRAAARSQQKTIAASGLLSSAFSNAYSTWSPPPYQARSKFIFDGTPEVEASGEGPITNMEGSAAVASRKPQQAEASTIAMEHDGQS